MNHRPQLEVVAAPDELAVVAAAVVVDRIRAVHAQGRIFRFAVSGGRTPWAMFEHVRSADLMWDRVEIFQVDERVAPLGDSSRNLTHLLAGLPAAATVHAMPVDDADLDAAADRYAAELPERLDLIHLGLGPDGHTASLVPGDSVLSVTDRVVAMTSAYQGQRRMTLTYPGIARAAEVLWLVAGGDKADALRSLLDGDLSIPASRVEVPVQLALVDRSAAARL